MTLEDLNNMLVTEGYLEIEPLPSADEVLQMIGVEA